MDLVPTILEEIAIKKCGVSESDFKKMITCQLTYEEWEKNESIQRFCADIKKRIDSATERDDVVMSLLELDFRLMLHFDCDHRVIEQEITKIEWQLNRQERELGSEYVDTNQFLLNVGIEFGSAYLICDLFRSTDFARVC